MFFQQSTCKDQFYVRALLAKSLIESRKVIEKGFKGE